MTDLSALLKTAVGDAYRIERELGGGGMSRVFVAEEVALGRKVVIKVMPPELAASVNADRFRREIQLAAQLQHPAIVPLLTAGSSAELLWYVMPFVPGESLRGRIARQGPLPLDDAVRIWRDLLEALEYAHQHSVVHRDVKPENIMMSGRHAVAMDFGVAKAVSAATGTAALSGMTMAATQTGMAIGTPAYMSPEQAAGDPNLDGRTDLYAAGLVMYEMLAGKGPFEARTPSEMLAAHLAKAPPPLGALRPDASAALVEMVMQCLAKDPVERPASAAVLLQALDGLSSQTSGARSPNKSGTADKRSRLRLVVAGIIGVAALTGGGYAFQARQAAIEAKAMLAVGLPDSARFGVAFVPTASDAADTVIARSLSSIMEATLQADRRLSVLGDDRVRNLLSDAGIVMNPPPPDSVRMLTREYGGHTYLLRSLARAGTGFVLSAEGRSVSSDSVLFQLQETAQSASDLPDAARRLSETTRRMLLDAVGRVEQAVPTGSLWGTTPEAARLYSEALTLYGRGDYLSAAAVLRRTLQIDSTFAFASGLLAQSVGNISLNPNEEFISYRNGYRNLDRLRSLAWRRYFEAYYLLLVGDIEGTLRSGQEGLRISDVSMRSRFRNVIGNAYRRRGDFDLATPLLEQNHREQLAQPGIHTANYLGSLLEQGRIADVQRVVIQLDSAVGAKHPSTLAARIALAYGQRNADTILAISRQQLSAANTDAARLTGLTGYQIGTQMRGQLDSMFAAATERRMLFAKGKNVGALVAAATQEAIARVELLADRTQATRVLDEALTQVRWDTLPALDRSYGSVINARLALGDVSSARQMVADWERGVPSELASVQARPIAEARGEIALAEKKGSEALAAFRAGVSKMCPTCTALNYARAFDQLGRADSTIYWYENVLASSTNRMSQENARFLARTYKRLGELYEAKGDLKNAIQRYSDFIALWKDADKSLQPAVQEAKGRVARLQAKRG